MHVSLLFAFFSQYKIWSHVDAFVCNASNFTALLYFIVWYLKILFLFILVLVKFWVGSSFLFFFATTNNIIDILVDVSDVHIQNSLFSRIAHKNEISGPGPMP